MGMFGKNAGEMIVGCANDLCKSRRFPAKNLLFICSGGANCEGARTTSPHYKEFFADQQRRYPEKFLFSPRRFNYSVKCPLSDHNCYLKVCPNCGQTQPISMGDASTIAVIGSGSSGKTCFITSLIYQIDALLARQSMLGMSMEWRDDEGRSYFRNQRRALFDLLELPQSTQKKSKLKSLDITIRFPLRGLRRRLVHGNQAVVSLVFPDPAGEWFQSLADVYYLTYLAQAQQVMLMLDPMASTRLRAERKKKELGKYDAVVDSPEGALEAFISAVRNQMALPKGKIPKDLAVVLTKCDEPGVFDADRQELPHQGRDFNPKIADEISDLVAVHLEEELEISGVVSMAKENFRRVAFFAASALGKPPLKLQVGDEVVARLDGLPKPRRVEEPFLWILHCRGLI